MHGIFTPLSSHQTVKSVGDGTQTNKYSVSTGYMMELIPLTTALFFPLTHILLPLSGAFFSCLPLGAIPPLHLPLLIFSATPFSFPPFPFWVFMSLLTIAHRMERSCATAEPAGVTLAVGPAGNAVGGSRDCRDKCL